MFSAIEMNIIFLGIGTFALAFILHLVVWRIKIPQNQAKALLKIFFSMQLLILSFLAVDLILFDNNLSVVQTVADLLHLFLFTVALTLVYITAFSAIEADSPTVMIVMHMIEAGDRGLSEKELHSKMTDETLLKPRIRYLEYNNLAYSSDNKYSLTKQGLYFVRAFISFRKLMRIKKGG